MLCKKCGGELNEEMVCQSCGTRFVPVERTPLQKLIRKVTRRKEFRIAVLVLPVVIAAVLLISILSSAFTSTQDKLLSAVEKTLLKTESLAFEISEGGSSADGILLLGDDIYESSLYIKMGSKEYICHNGKITVTSSYDENVFSEQKELKTALAELYGEKYEDLYSDIVNNGKLSEDAVEDYFNNTLRAELAEKYSLDEKDIPKYDKVKKTLIKFLNDSKTEEALTVEKSHSSKGVKYYNIEGNGGALVDCLETYLSEEKAFDALMATDFINFFDSLAYSLDGDFALTVGVDGGRIVSVEFDDVEITAEDFNKIDKDELEELNSELAAEDEETTEES